MATRVLLADGEVALRQTLRAFLERENFTVVAETVNGGDAVELARQHHPDVAVLELDLAGMNGLRAAREIIRTCPSVAVIVLAKRLDDRDVIESLRNGVRGLVLKRQPIDDLVQALRQVSQGGVYVGPSLSKAVVQVGRASATARAGQLTIREREVLMLVVEGKTTKQIAGALNIRPKTAGYHRARLMKKLDIHDTAGLVRYAIRQGLAAP